MKPTFEWCGWQERYDPVTFAVIGHIELWTLIAPGHEFHFSTKSASSFRVLGYTVPEPPVSSPRIKTLQPLKPSHHTDL